MSRYKKDLVGKIGYCENCSLGIDKPGGHYVYIRGVNGRKCDVNVVTSMEDRNGNYNFKRIRNLRQGNIYALPVPDADFSRWSGIGKNSIKNVPLSDVKDIGKKEIKQRHKFFIGKFMR